MTCVHLRQLYKHCHQHNVKLGSSDLIRIVCEQCGEQEVCPSTLMDEYESKETQQPTDSQEEGSQDPAR